MIENNCFNLKYNFLLQSFGFVGLLGFFAGNTKKKALLINPEQALLPPSFSAQCLL